MQVYVGVSFAGPQASTMRSESSFPMPQQATGSLTTQGNKPITLNGAAAISGATLLSGASIETPGGVGATVSLSALGSLQIDANTKLTLGSIWQREGDGHAGLLTLRTKKGTTGEIDTAQGVAGKTNPAKDGVTRSCPGGAAPAAPVATGAGGLFGIGVGETISLLTLTATFVVIPIAARGRNPSPVIL